MNKKAGFCNERQLRNRTNEVLFMDLRRWDQNIEEIVIDKGKKKKKTVLTDEQIAKVKSVYSNWQDVNTDLYEDVPEFCRSVKLDGENGLRANDYALTPSNYIEFVDHDMEIDYEKEMIRIQTEMFEVMKAEKESQRMLVEAFRGIGYGID